MTRVVLSQVAVADLRRLETWLKERAPDAASRVGPRLAAALESLTEYPERGRAGPRPDLRELVAPFGGGAYLIQYRLRDDVVLVARIKHSRERR